ncbi:hypothetical protein [Herbaspirillum robiniae]|uniref:Uncharacterized protein n=1 Tax=Herbaspirillum robiniae TaxID=2014887 RepID=A0ABX2LZF0_9BURK|nr:hypothetical protein [Herbaspirillum robiniae]NUU03847.1 hypothetical protein [Herbaspirillum robiniae]
MIERLKSQSQALKQSIVQSVINIITFCLVKIVESLPQDIQQLVWNKIRRGYRKQKFVWLFMGRSYRIYYFAFAMTLIYVVVILLSPRSHLVPWLLFGCAPLYAAGMVTWSVPMIQKFGSAWWGKWVFIVANAFVLVFSTVKAREVVQQALLFPPQYFDLTVTLVTLVTYIPAALVVSMFVIGGLAVPFILLWLAAELIPMAMASMLHSPILFPVPPSRVGRRARTRILKLIFAIAGATSILFFAQGVLGYATKILNGGGTAIRMFAYRADFQPSGRYPGVQCEGKTRLMDNGVIAVATLTDDDVVIERKMFPEKPDLAIDCSIGQ